jgi:hypothetical protein
MSHVTNKTFKNDVSFNVSSSNGLINFEMHPIDENECPNGLHIALEPFYEENAYKKKTEARP